MGNTGARCKPLSRPGLRGSRYDRASLPDTRIGVTGVRWCVSVAVLSRAIGNSPRRIGKMLLRLLACLASLVLIPAVAIAADPVAECNRLAANPSDPGHVGPGVAFEAIDSHAAITACLGAVDANPNDARLVYQLGRAYDSGKDFAAAENAYLRAADLHLPAAMRNLGYLYLDATGGNADRVKAERWFLAAIKAGDTDAMNEVAWLWAVANVRLKEAAALSMKAVEAEPEDPEYRDTLGWIHFRLGEGEKAAAELEHALRIAPDDASFHAHLGWIYEALGRDAEARTEWQRALDLPPPDPTADPTFDRPAIEAKLKVTG